MDGKGLERNNINIHNNKKSIRGVGFHSSMTVLYVVKEERADTRHSSQRRVVENDVPSLLGIGNISKG